MAEGYSLFVKFSASVRKYAFFGRFVLRCNFNFGRVCVCSKEVHAVRSFESTIAGITEKLEFCSRVTGNGEHCYKIRRSHKLHDVVPKYRLSSFNFVGKSYSC